MGTPASRWTGALALVFWAVHAGCLVARHEPQHLLWTCHVACAAVGVGLLSSSPLTNAIGVLWLSAGVPLWLLDVAMGGVFHPTSVLTHFGGLLLGVAGVRTLGLPRDAWMKAVGALLALGLVTRLLTPPGANVNLAFAIWPGWERYFPSYVVYVVVNLALCAAVFFAAERGLRLSGATAGQEPS